MPQYAVIDCAADDALYAAVLIEPQSKSLLEGKISADLIDATPHIARLADGSPLFDVLWSGSQPFGFFCASALSLMQVRRQLRRNLQALLPDGQIAMFRFFDPRVFPTYIENGPEEGLGPWFGSITDWWIPVQTGVLHYCVVDDSLHKRILQRS